jgi:aspartyl-tRNA(Asn)/glutamyl-tRNA(Gln) amidotransferase subunit B
MPCASWHPPNHQPSRSRACAACAVGGRLADYTEFDRKSYFYPDIPKGYQISQYEHPLVSGGMLADVALTRIHLEEDTARSSHDTKDGTSLVDFNRAGVPLMELVTEPVMHDAQQAGLFARELQALLRALGASHANLEKGEMRIEANISVSKDDTFGTKVEVKNLNSFRSVERAIAYEIARQGAALEAGEAVHQETRGWNETTQVTFHQRYKEGSADYRYFPEPDLPKIFRSTVPAWSDDTLQASLPELPSARRERYQALGLKDEDARFFAYERLWGDFFDEACVGSGEVTMVANYLNDVRGILSAEGVVGNGSLAPQELGSVAAMRARNELSSSSAKEVLKHLVLHGGSADTVAKQLNLIQVHDQGALEAVVLQVIADNPKVVEEFKTGKEPVLQYLVGQCMKLSKGSGNPQTFAALLREKI